MQMNLQKLIEDQGKQVKMMLEKQLKSNQK
ncbi:hypothetical protein CISIN_1g0447221mg, partial [Citrus sinensis]